MAQAAEDVCFLSFPNLYLVGEHPTSPLSSSSWLACALSLPRFLRRANWAFPAFPFFLASKAFSYYWIFFPTLHSRQIFFLLYTGCVQCSCPFIIGGHEHGKKILKTLRETFLAVFNHCVLRVSLQLLLGLLPFAAFFSFTFSRRELAVLARTIVPPDCV